MIIPAKRFTREATAMQGPGPRGGMGRNGFLTEEEKANRP